MTRCCSGGDRWCCSWALKDEEKFARQEEAQEWERQGEGSTSAQSLGWGISLQGQVSESREWWGPWRNRPHPAIFKKKSEL